MIKYENGQLVIGIRSASPDELHMALTQSVINSLKHQSMSDVPLEAKDKEHNFWMYELLETLTVNPNQIEKSKK